jgi:hypothetical protein
MEDFFTPFLLICENKQIKNHDPSNSKNKNKNFQPLRKKKSLQPPSFLNEQKTCNNISILLLN